MKKIPLLLTVVLSLSVLGGCATQTKTGLLLKKAAERVCNLSPEARYAEQQILDAQTDPYVYRITCPQSPND